MGETVLLLALASLRWFEEVPQDNEGLRAPPDSGSERRLETEPVRHCRLATTPALSLRECTRGGTGAIVSEGGIPGRCR